MPPPPEKTTADPLRVDKLPLVKLATAVSANVRPSSFSRYKNRFNSSLSFHLHFNSFHLLSSSTPKTLISFSIFLTFKTLNPDFNYLSASLFLLKAMEAFAAAPIDRSCNMDKLSYEIFSILEAKFLFGYDNPKLLPPSPPVQTPVTPAGKVCIPPPAETVISSAGKVRILSIDAAGSTDGILAAKSLSLIESSLRRKTANPDARIADFFDVAAGSGAGGVLVALLFTRGEDGRPLLSAADALKFLLNSRRRASAPSKLRRMFGIRESGPERMYRKMFSEYTLKDTLKPVLIPCYDVLTAPFLFSRADAMETDGYDFKMREVCLATCADPNTVGPVQMRSLDRKNKILAVDGRVAMSNPTAAAITHVLNNKQEFPFCRGVEDLMVLSLGDGESDSGVYGQKPMTPRPGKFVRVAGDGASDMVDQAVSMAFGDLRTTNYVRIKGNGLDGGRSPKAVKNLNLSETQRVLAIAEEMLEQKNVESVLFRGKKIAEKANTDKLDWFAEELMKEKERRKLSIFPTVVFKQQGSPRTSSATTSSC